MPFFDDRVYHVVDIGVAQWKQLDIFSADREPVQLLCWFYPDSGDQGRQISI